MASTTELTAHSLGPQRKASGDSWPFTEQKCDTDVYCPPLYLIFVSDDNLFVSFHYGAVNCPQWNAAPLISSLANKITFPIEFVSGLEKYERRRGQSSPLAAAERFSSDNWVKIIQSTRERFHVEAWQRRVFGEREQFHIPNSAWPARGLSPLYYSLCVVQPSTQIPPLLWPFSLIFCKHWGRRTDASPKFALVDKAMATGGAA